MWQNVRYGLRILRKNRGFTAIGVITLGPGRGATPAIFSVVDSLLLRSLTLREPGNLVFLSAFNPQRGIAGGGFSLASYETLRDGNRSFSGITAFCPDGFSLTAAGEPDQIAAARVSPNFLDVLGAQPFMGRGFTPEEGDPGARPAVLISRALWARRFASDPNILGKSINLDNEAYTVVGVMPQDFPFPFTGRDAWVTRILKYGGFQPEQIRAGAGFLTAIARLKPGVSREQAEAEVAVLREHYRQKHPAAPDADPRSRLTVVTLQESLVTGIRQTLLILMGAVGM